MDRTRWIIFAVVCVALIGLLVFTRDSGAPAFEGDPAKVVENDNVYGKRDSGVVLVEYGDFQCPGCGSLYPTLKEVKEQYKDKIAVVFRHLPLTNIHPNAKAAAAAAEAAARQNKFWEMHDLLYENQQQWSSAQANNRSGFFESYAEQIGLDMEKYRADVGSPAVTERVNRDLGIARQAGFELSTPTLILNGKQIELGTIQTDGQYNAGKLREAFNKALRAAGQEPPKVTSKK